jgi:hypothetical protein
MTIRKISGIILAGGLVIGAITTFVNKLSDLEKALKKEKDTRAELEGKLTNQAKQIADQQQIIQKIIVNGMTPAGTFGAGLMESLTNFFSVSAASAANVTIVADFASYGCISHPVEYDALVGQILGAADSSNQINVTMILYSDELAKKTTEDQFTKERWVEQYVHNADMKACQKLAKWFKREDVASAVSSLNIDPGKLFAFQKGEFLADDRETLIACSLAYNAWMIEQFKEHQISVFKLREVPPIHLWMVDKSPQGDAVSGIMSIADWASSFDEPGFFIRKITYNQMNSIAKGLLKNSDPF